MVASPWMARSICWNRRREVVPHLRDSESALSYLLFDVDGTLIDSRTAILEAYRIAVTDSPTTAAALRSIPSGQLLQMRLSEAMQAISPSNAAMLEARFDNIYREISPKLVHPYPHVPELVRWLHRSKIGLGVVTNKGRDRLVVDLPRVVEPHTCEEIFRVVIAAEDTVERKPHPEPLLRAADRAGWPHDDVAYIGDGPHDAEAAEAAGMAFIGAGWGYYGRTELRSFSSAPVATTVTELRSMLNERLGLVVRAD